MSKLVFNAIVVVGALVLGVGAGTGWWFTVGQATSASSQLDGTSSGTSSSSTGDGRFHADDLDQFLLTESQAADGAPSDFAVTIERSITVPWCGGRECQPMLPAGCDDLILTMSPDVIEPIALSRQTIVGAAPDAPITQLVAQYTVMLYPTPQHARAEFERVTAAAGQCASSPGGGAAVTQDEVVDEVEVRSGSLLPNGENLGWAIALRGNVMLHLGTWPDTPLRPAAMPPVVEHIVSNANAAVPVAAR